MPALIDARCVKCGKRFGWPGEMKDMPPCPKCGYRPDLTELEADQKMLDQLEEEILARKNKPQ